MGLEVDGIYNNGVLTLDQPLPLKENERVRITVHPQAGRVKRNYGLLRWTGSVEALDAMINDPDNV